MGNRHKAQGKAKGGSVYSGASSNVASEARSSKNIGKVSSYIGGGKSKGRIKKAGGGAVFSNAGGGSASSNPMGCTAARK